MVLISVGDEESKNVTEELQGATFEVGVEEVSVLQIFRVLVKVDMIKSLAIKGYVPFVIITILKMKPQNLKFLLNSTDYFINFQLVGAGLAQW